MGNGATGPKGDRVYAVAFESVDAVGLAIRPDPELLFVHAFIEPREAMPLGEYEEALASTQQQWRQVWP
jgi:hypothetical protein